MNSHDLTQDHAAQISDAVARHLGALGALRRQLQRELPPDDPVYLATVEAWERLHELRVRAHYLSVAMGVGG